MKIFKLRIYFSQCIVSSRNTIASCVTSQPSSLLHLKSLALSKVPSYNTLSLEHISSRWGCFNRSTKYLPATESSCSSPRTIILSSSKQNFPSFVQNVFVPTFSVILTLCLFRLKTLLALSVTVHHRVLEDGCDSLGNNRTLTVTFFLVSFKRFPDMLSSSSHFRSLVVEWSFGLNP